MLNWNRRQDTLACLASLVALEDSGAHQRILLVDNGSTDDTVAAVRSAVPSVEVLALSENRGYAAGVNAGIRHALDQGADWTLLANNDTVAEPDMLAKLRGAATDPAVGLLAPTVYYADVPGQVWPSAGWRRAMTLAAFDTTARPPTRGPYDVDWATGCCVFVRRQLWEDVGLFDERFRVYYEDHDLCLRAKAAGWRILHVPEASIHHRVSASTGPGSPEQMYLLARSSVPYYLAHTTGFHRVLIVAYRLGSLARTLSRSLAAGRPAAGLAYVRGLRDGVRDEHRRRRGGIDSPRRPDGQRSRGT